MIWLTRRASLRIRGGVLATSRRSAIPLRAASTSTDASATHRKLVHVHSGDFERDLACFDTRDIEHVLDQRAQPRSRIAHDGQLARLRISQRS
jgi:hypothetical protein